MKILKTTFHLKNKYIKLKTKRKIKFIIKVMLKRQD